MTASHSAGPPPYVVDRDGVVWAVVRDGGMVTRAHDTGVVSAGVAWLEREAGPLVPLDAAAWRAEQLDRAAVSS